MKSVLYFLSAAAAVGLPIALIAHVVALLGRPGPFAGRESSLFLGLIVVWLPTIFASNLLSKDVPRSDLWKATLRGCPVWMKYLTYCCFGYAMLNFVLVAAGGNANNPRIAAGMPFAGLLPFFGTAGAVLYSAARLWGQTGRRCPEGHLVRPLAKFCDQCGRPVIDFQGTSVPPPVA